VEWYSLQFFLFIIDDCTDEYGGNTEMYGVWQAAEVAGSCCTVRNRVQTGASDIRCMMAAVRRLLYFCVLTTLYGT
jgi:hypothetical protein